MPILPLSLPWQLLSLPFPTFQVDYSGQPLQGNAGNLSAWSCGDAKACPAVRSDMETGEITDPKDKTVRRNFARFHTGTVRFDVFLLYKQNLLVRGVMASLAR